MTATYALIVATFFTFVADNILRMNLMKATPSLFRPLVSVFCHANNAHLYGNAFLLLLFGRRVEEDLGWRGMVVAYLFCGVCANMASLLLLPGNTISLGASGAVFGLFTVSMLSRMRARELEWRRVVEFLIICEFRLIETVSFDKAGAPLLVAHLAGVGSGVALVFLLRALLVNMERSEYNGWRPRDSMRV